MDNNNAMCDTANTSNMFKNNNNIHSDTHNNKGNHK